MWTNVQVLLSQGSHRSGKIVKTFSSQGMTGGFQPKSRRKCSNQGTFFQTILKPFNLLNNVFKDCRTFLSGTARKLHLMRQYLHRLISIRPYLKRINVFFKLQCLGENLGKDQGKILRNHGKIREFHGKKWKPGFQKPCSGGSRIFQMGGHCFVTNGGAHILFSGKKCMKLKEIGLKWGGARLLAPCYSKITIFL